MAVGLLIAACDGPESEADARYRRARVMRPRCEFSARDTAEIRARLGELFTSDPGAVLSIAQVDSTSLGRLVRVDLRRTDGNVQLGGGGLLYWDPADGCVWVVKHDE